MSQKRVELTLAIAGTLAMLTGCHGAGSANTQTLNGRFIAANPRRMQMRLEQPGQLSDNLILPLDPKVAITVGGKATPLEKIPAEDHIRVTKDLDTHKVTRIEAD